VGVQAELSTHVTQLPAEQTWSVPQVVPSTTGVWVHTGLPVSQVIAAVWQASTGEHVGLGPGSQTQAPPAQARSVPQLAPSLAGVCVHTGLPVSQVIAAVLQALMGEHVGLGPGSQTQAPPAQARSVPQAVPSDFGVAESTQVCVPVEQSVTPSKHALGFVPHGCPAVHALQTPSPQTKPAPHDVPFGRLPLSVHTGAPVLHVVVPVLHGLSGEQISPTVHGVQTPPPQTRLTPQLVPSATRPPASVHVGPALHDSVPVWHGLAGTHEDPATQPTHAPTEQTRSVPHDVPFATSPFSVQTGVPLPHTISPVRHAFVGMQASPAVHGLQTPPPQTALAPQLVPSAMGLPVSLQTGPAPHDRVPAWHGLAGVHADPSAHATHAPSLQTRSVPQLVPLGWFPFWAQTGNPVLHVTTAVRHASPDGQLVPASQALQAPPPQTASGPQLVPSGSTVASSLQTGPAVHDRTPPWHGFVGVHAVPGAHETHAPPEQTRSVPQPVPSGSSPVFVQTGNPVLQVSAAVRHGSGDAHASPTAHGLHTPPPQTASMPQLVPSTTGVPVSLQTGPAVQESVPVWQAFAGVHAEPATQATQVPPEQTESTPHVVPSGSLPLSTHAGSGPAQEITPVRQGSLDSHAAPAVQDRRSQLAETLPSTPQLLV
jgi:hypothetical protein